MARKPTYEELEQRVKELENEVFARKRAEEALQESEDRFRSLFENSLDAVLLTGTDGTIFHANPAACEMFACSEEELCAAGRQGVVDLSDHRFVPGLERRARNGKVMGELTFLRKDGSRFQGEISSSIFTDRKGRPRSSMVIRDITERRLAEQTVQDNEKRFRAAFSASPIAIAISTWEDGVCIDANQVALDMFGYTREEAMGESVLASNLWVDPDDRQNIVAALGRSGGVRNQEVRLRRKDGKIMIASVSAQALTLNGVKHILFVTEDVTKRKRAEEMLKDNEAFLKTLINAIPNPVFYKGRDGKYFGSTALLRTFFGTTKECLIGKSVFDVNPPELAEIYHAQDNRLFNSGGVQCYDSQMKNARGELRDIIFNKAVFTDSRGAVTGLIGAITDITERKQAEEEKRRLQAQLQQSQKMEAIGTLAGGIAHDFNNILAIILGNAELASNDVPDSNPISDALKEIFKASIRARDMIRQLLAFSRKTEEESSPINMAPIIKESMKMLRCAIPASVGFKLHISNDPCSVMGDAAQINQIVMNLVTNAVDAMSKHGGVLDVTLDKIILQQKKTCFDWVLSPGPYVRLRMRDTGEGIEPEIMDRIFEPYFTTKEVGKGTGMGLSVVHGIVKRNGGGILVESEPGKGTL